MLDLKIIAIRDLLQLSGVQYATGVLPISIDIRGQNLQDATSVLINSIAAPEFVVLSNNRILAQVPVGLEKTVINEVTVLAERPSVNRSSLLHFDVGNSIKTLRGLERLVQLFCKILLQTPGSDRFRPSIGGGLMTLVGQTMGKSGDTPIKAAFMGAVSRAREQVMTLQAGNPRIPLDELLQTADVDSLGYDANTTTLMARVSISAVSGKQAVANLSF